MNNRRHFLAAAAAGSIASLAPWPAWAATGRVIVVGGGMAGATAAKYLRLWSNKSLDVTLIEQNASYTSNIMSNLVVTGQMAMSSLNVSYGNLVKTHGVKLVTSGVTAVERVNGQWKVSTRTATGVVGTYYADKVVLAPGIQMDAVPETFGQPGQAAPVLHAWIAGPQTDELRKRLQALPDGSTFLMSIPGKPYRCPPGPYERACVVADYLKRNKPNSKVIVLDANDDVIAEPHNFHYAFDTLYAGMLQYVPKTKVVSVDSATGTVTTASTVDGSLHTFQAQLLNIIPPHRAAGIAQSVGLTNATNKPFAQVDPSTFEAVGMAGMYVIGDAHQTAGSTGTGLPMAGHVGNQEAKICANAIVNAFAGKTVDTAFLTANSACFSPLSNTQASWLTAVYHYEADPANPAIRKYFIHDYVSGVAGTATEAASPSSENFKKMNTWFKTLMADTFT